MKTYRIRVTATREYEVTITADSADDALKAADQVPDDALGDVVCAGRGADTIPCPECFGTGTLSGSASCPVCGGDGDADGDPAAARRHSEMSRARLVVQTWEGADACAAEFVERHMLDANWGRRDIVEMLHASCGGEGTYQTAKNLLEKGR